MNKKEKDKSMTKTSVRQPRELWNKLHTDAITQSKTIDEVLTEILEEHYGLDLPSEDAPP